MKGLYYSLPYFSKNGEVKSYIESHLRALIYYEKTSNFHFEILKEKALSSIGEFDEELNINLVNFNTNEKMRVFDFIKSRNFNFYHCLHNGFSLGAEGGGRKFSTIYTTLPLSNREVVDKSYEEKYLNSIENTLRLSNGVVVPFYFMKRELLLRYHYDDNRIFISPPFLPMNIIGKSKILSKAYVKSKFHVYEDYYIYMGEINSRNNLKETIRLFKHLSNFSDEKLLLSLSFLPKNKGLYLELIKLIDDLSLSSRVIFLNNLTFEDKINLINASLYFINLNPYDELNVTSIYSMLLNTRILTYASLSNFEYLENFPTYIEDFSSSFKVDFHTESDLTLDEIYEISSKFNLNSVLESFKTLYGEGF
ncbi:MAG: hypothetical protein ACRC2K_03020 [Clostridium sp.]